MNGDRGGEDMEKGKEGKKGKEHERCTLHWRQLVFCIFFLHLKIGIDLDLNFTLIIDLEIYTGFHIVLYVQFVIM